MKSGKKCRVSKFWLIFWPTASNIINIMLITSSLELSDSSSVCGTNYSFIWPGAVYTSFVRGANRSFTLEAFQEIQVDYRSLVITRSLSQSLQVFTKASCSRSFKQVIVRIFDGIFQCAPWNGKLKTLNFWTLWVKFLLIAFYFKMLICVIHACFLPSRSVFFLSSHVWCRAEIWVEIL